MGYGWHGSRVETKAERAARRSLSVNATRAEIAARSDEQKIELLASAIVAAIADRGLVAPSDLCRSGLCDHEIERLYPAAIETARALDPAVFAGALE